MVTDADRILEDATDELYEDAYSDISKKSYDELQHFLDEWCKKCGVGTTYMESHEYKIRIPWEEYKPETQEKTEVVGA